MKFSVFKSSRPYLEVDFDNARLNEGLEILCGRREGAPIYLDDPRLSREHAYFYIKEGGLWIRKGAPTSSVKVNGSEVQQAQLFGTELIELGVFQIQLVGAEFQHATPAPSQAASLVGSSAIQGSPAAVAGPSGGVEQGMKSSDGVLPAAQVLSPDVSEDDELFESQSDEVIQNDSVEEISDYDNSLDDSDDLSDDLSDSDGGDDDFQSLQFDRPSSEPVEEETEEEPSESLDFSDSSESDDDQSDGGMNFDQSDTNDFGGGMSGSFGMVESGSDGDSTQVMQTFVRYELHLLGEYIPYDRYILQDEETFIGRDQEKCQIPLNDPEVSSIHAVIKRKAGRYSLEDQKSANGVMVNGERVNQHELIQGDEFIIGSTVFTVEVASELLAAEEDRLMPVEANQEITREEIVEEEVDFDLTEGDEGADEGNKKKSIFADPKKRKFLIYGAVGLMLLMLLSDDDKKVATGPEKKKKEAAQKAPEKAKELNTFSPEQIQYMETHYQIANSRFEAANYSDAVLELDKVRAINPNYKNTKQLYELAKEGLRRIENQERERRKAIETAKRRKKVKELLDKATKAVKDRQVLVAEAIFGQIYKLDPENIEVSQLKLEIEAYKKEQERKRQEEERRKAARKRMVDLLSPGKKFYLNKQYYKAILKLDEFLDRKGMDEDLIKEATDMLQSSKEELKKLVEPLLGKARSLKEGDDLKGAYETYESILKIDPASAESLAEMTSIREQLNSKSRKVYREGIIAESLSLFEEAKAKFEEVRQISPIDSEYYSKASDKLKDYLE